MAEDPAPSRPVGMTAGLAPSSRRNGRDALLLVAFAAIYLVWGSTYLAIRYAVETVPPQLMAGLRVTTPARVATYAYVNPVVAIGLGAVVGNEPVTPGAAGNRSSR